MPLTTEELNALSTVECGCEETMQYEESVTLWMQRESPWMVVQTFKSGRIDFSCGGTSRSALGLLGWVLT